MNSEYKYVFIIVLLFFEVQHFFEESCTSLQILIYREKILCYYDRSDRKGDVRMYINDLGIGRVNTDNSVSKIAAVNNRSNISRLANQASSRTTDSYATVMQKAVDSQKTTTPTFASAGDIIIQEAFKKMETDPEWEESVMGKVKDYYAGDYTVDSTQKSYLSLLGQNGLQNYLIQSLIGGQGSLGLTGYSPYGVSGLAASAYGSVMNNGLGSSFFGNWQL